MKVDDVALHKKTAHGSRLTAHGLSTRHKAHGARYKTQGLRRKAHGVGFEDRCLYRKPQALSLVFMPFALTVRRAPCAAQLCHTPYAAPLFFSSLNEPG